MTPFGDRAVRFPVPSSIAERRALLERLRDVPGVRDVVLCEEMGCVVFEDGADRSLVANLRKQPVASVDEAATTQHVVRVIYDGEDVDALGLARDDVVRLHTAGDYHVSMLGFLPGFAYLRGLSPALCVPRRAPRPRVPAHSVAIGADYTGIYPVASAGGWHLLGRALDVPRFELGDRVRFEAAAAAPPGEPPPDDRMAPPTGPHLVITRMAGLALFVDGGRPGQMHRGMPPGGPLVRSAFDRANGWVGNEVLLESSVRIRGFLSVVGPREADRPVPTPSAIELTGTMELEARGGPVVIATDVDAPITLRERDRFILASAARRVAYLAIEGGFDAPIVEGSRNALLSAGIGRPLRRADALPRANARTRPRRAAISALPNTSDAIALRAGPDLDDELRAAIEAGAFAISPTSDRAGTRLTGPALRSSANRHASTPMVEGAIELTPSGLVVLGPDHPTTGGYPVPALLASGSRDAFFARPLGAPVRFRFA